MIINFWSIVDKFEAFLSDNTNISWLFVGWISAWKPIIQWEWLSLYFSLENNSPLISSSRKNSWVINKRALVQFVLVSNKKDTPQVELFEALDLLTNEICEKRIFLDTFEILGINEDTQSWVTYDENENPIIIALYQIDYKSKY